MGLHVAVVLKFNVRKLNMVHINATRAKQSFAAHKLNNEKRR